jgi:hypothetical protein
MASLPQTREAWACAIDALIVDDPRALNAWMTQGLVLLKQQAEEAKAARRPRGVVVEDGIDEMQSSASGIPTDTPDDAQARWAAKVAARHGMSGASSMPQGVDPNLAGLVRAAVQEYMQGMGGTPFASPPPAAGYGYPAPPAPVVPPPLPHYRQPMPNYWYDPRRR